MFKWLRLLILPALIATVILVTRHYKDYDAAPRGYGARCIQENQSSPAAGYLVCSIETSQNAQTGKPQLQWWDKLLSWPEGITAWLILLTLYAIGWQSWETRKSAQAARNSIRLQELAMQQWIVLNNWRSEIITVSGYSYADDSPRHRLRIRVDIVNPTSAPLTLNEATIVFRLPINAHSTYGAPKDHFLTPNAPYTVDVSLDLSPGFVESFRVGVVTLPVEGKFIHLGSLKRPLTQDMSGMLVCGPTNTHFESEMPMHPKEQSTPEQT
jgi:hypothetical protein